MKHILFLALLAFSLLQPNWLLGQGLVFLDCPDTLTTVGGDDGVFSLPDNNVLIVGAGNPNATTCSGHLRIAQEVMGDCGIIIDYIVDYYPFNGNQMIRLQDTIEAFLDNYDLATLVLDTRLFGVGSPQLNGLPYNDACPDSTDGKHRIVWTVIDGCGNTAVCEMLVRIEDRVSPTAQEVAFTEVNVPAAGQVALAAQDLVLSALDDCSPFNWLVYSFAEENLIPARIFSCSEILDSNNLMQLTVWVADGGVDSDCNGQIVWNERSRHAVSPVLFFTGECEAISDTNTANILSENMVPVSGATVAIDFGSIQTEEVTNQNGEYSLLPPKSGLTIDLATPSKDGDDPDGVSTLDLVKIQKHLLGLEPFDSPYKYIAADANNNEAVSAADLLELRKLILTIYDELPNNQSWRFVPEEFVFADVDDPWPFDESITGGEGVDNFNFIGVKVGDLNGTVTEPPGTHAPIGTSIAVDDILVNPGESVVVPVRAGSAIDGCQGLQIALDLDGLTIVDVLPGRLAIRTGEYLRAEDRLVLSHVDLGIGDISSGEVLFALAVRSQVAGPISRFIDLDNKRLRAEVYSTADHGRDVPMPIDLEFDQIAGNVITLCTAAPNPFSNQTDFRFYNAIDGNVALLIFDANGREVYAYREWLTRGEQLLRVNMASVQVKGCLFYKLQTGASTFQGRLIRL